MDSIIKIGFWEKAFKSLRLALAKVGLAEDEWGYSGFHEDLTKGDTKELVKQIQNCLEMRGGEVSARARATNLGHIYLTLSSLGRKTFLKILYFKTKYYVCSFGPLTHCAMFYVM